MRRDYFPPLQENYYYHIYNRGNNGSPIFFKPENHGYFLRKLHQYLSAYLDFHAYCLLPNHFHLLARVKNFQYIHESNRVLTKGYIQLTLPGEIISEQFRRFFLSYSKSIKIQEKRTGSI